MIKNHNSIKYIFIFLYSVWTIQIVKAESKLLLSGPMIGYAELHNVLIWLEVSPEVNSIVINYWVKNTPPINYRKSVYTGPLGNKFNTVRHELYGLDANTEFYYDIMLNNKKIEFDYLLSFKTQPLLKNGSEYCEFSFLIGSCAYINDPSVDKPGKPFGQSPEIFETMANIESGFMIWLGDNVYFRNEDLKTPQGMYNRYVHARHQPYLQKLLSTRSHYAIWDDHDFGPNDSYSSFELKDTSLAIFKNYWGNQTYGEKDNPGIYSKFQWCDAEFFLMDNRYHRSENNMNEIVDGKPNTEKHFYGEKQLQWLKNGLHESKSVFKFIATGGQSLNVNNNYESFLKYPSEYNELLDFIKSNKIEGVIFLSGDHHLSEILKVEQKDFYPFYEFTCSPLTSKFFDIKNLQEFNNPLRVPNTLIQTNNFGLISIKGEPNERKVIIETFDRKNNKLFEYIITENELKCKD